ncbi:hypothetical protein FRC03_011230 [Tulasnella sp. 419]|nr:hypothetical protein FRC03_011230 [Tulasnella sp. 419]
MTASEQRPLLSQTNSYQSISRSPTPQPLNKPSKTDLAWILAALWSAVFLGALDGTIVATLLTSIGSHFDKAHQASYLGTSYLLSICCFTPLYGRLSDIIGLGTILCGLATSMNSLIAARAIAGMGGGGVMTVSSITTTDLIPLKRRGVYQGMANILYATGAGIGGPIGGFINDRFGWRWAFLCQIPILVISFILISIKVNVQLPSQRQTTREKLKRIDYLGSLTLVLGVSSLLLAVTLNSSEEIPWSHPYVWGLLLSSVIFITAFVFVEAKVAAEPIMPMRLLLQRTPLSVAICNLLLSVGSFSVLYNVPVYLTAVRLLSATDAGLRLLPNAVILACGSVGAGLIMRKTGRYYYLCLGSAVLSVITSVLMIRWNPSSAAWHMWIDILPNGLGISSLITSTLIALIASVGREDIAVATGISYLFRTTGQVLGVSLSGALMQRVLIHNLRKRIVGPGSSELIKAIRHSTIIIPSLDPPVRQAAVESYSLALRAVFIVQTAVALLTLLSCLPIEEHPLPGSHEEQALHEEQRRQRSSTGE